MRTGLTARQAAPSVLLPGVVSVVPVPAMVAVAFRVRPMVRSGKVTVNVAFTPDPDAREPTGQVTSWFPLDRLHPLPALTDSAGDDRWVVTVEPGDVVGPLLKAWAV